MRAKKRLFCTEASHLPTGYSVYTKEVLSRLCQDPAFEVAELACYCDASDPYLKECEWTIFPNRPMKDNPDWDTYQQFPTYQFGEYSFNTVALKFRPDFVMDIRDWWMLEFQQRSPFRDFFNWAIMPTVDAEPQNPQWVDTYSSANAVITYSEFGRDTLVNQSDFINFRGIAPPCASNSFSPVPDKGAHKDALGIASDAFIIGTVMRNQRRKLYPDLFSVFRDFLNHTKSDNAFLYCHTYFPDVGWDIPELLQEYGLSNRVLFTYKCKSCGLVYPSFFQDVFQGCRSCGEFNSHLVGIENKINEKELSQVYNLFDIYIQYANSEGFGMPQLEAAQCGVPVISIDYSAMHSIVRNIGAFGLQPLKLHTECETGCKRAIPNNVEATNLLIKLYGLSEESLKEKGMQMREETIKHYNWDTTAQAWSDYFKSVDLKDASETWLSPPKKFVPAPHVPDGLPHKEQVNFLFEHVLGKPEWIGGYQWKKTLRDLIYKCSYRSTNSDFYFNESHSVDNDIQKATPFNTEIAYDRFVQMCNLHNQWEDIRINEITQGTPS